MKSENEIIEGCKQHDTICQKWLFEMFYEKMLRICFRYTISKNEALEVLNKGFLKIFFKIKTFRQEGPFEAWISRIMINTAIEVYRAKKRLQIIHSNIELQTDIAIEPEIIGKIDAEEISQLINNLPEQHRLIFNLFAIEGFSYKEISKLLSLSNEACRWYVSQARKLLINELNKKNDERKLAK